MIESKILAGKRTMVKLLSPEWSRRLWKALYAVLPTVSDLGQTASNYLWQRPLERWYPGWSSGLFGIGAPSPGHLNLHAEGFLMHRIVHLGALTAMLLAGAGCSRKPADPPLGIDARLAAMAPREATILAGFRMDRIRKSPLYETYFKGRLPMGGETSREMMQFQEQIDEVLAAVTGKETMVLARGRMDRAAIETKLRSSKTPEETIAGRKGFAKDGVALVLLDGGLAVAGPRAQVEDALSRVDKTVALPARFFNASQTVPADSSMWVISVGRLPGFTMPERSNLANLPRALEHVELATASADLSSGVRMAAAATCTSDEDAKQIHTLFRGMIGMARLSTPNDNPELLKVFDRIQLVQTGRSVKIDANLPADVIQTLDGALGFRRSR